MESRTKYCCFLGVVSALAYAIMVLVRIPVGSFLTYDPKDVLLCLSGLIIGPVGAMVSGVIVAFLEMVTVSDTGIVGAVMNAMATACFVGPACWRYKKERTKRALWVGLGLGVLVMTAWMCLWNYVITPIYLGISKEVMLPLLYGVILPFNLIKGGVNAVLVLLLYRPILQGVARYKTNR